jgi:hypothetical protein
MAEPHHAPYENYRKVVKYIDDFVQISELSYGITKQLMKRHDKESLEKVKLPKPKRKELSFSMADIKLMSTQAVCHWISLPNYAKNVDLELGEVEQLAGRGDLGPIATHPETDETMVIWPPDYQSKPEGELPQPGKSKYAISITARASVGVDTEDHQDFDENQQKLISLAHRVGDAEELGTQAEAMLFQSSFLLQWTAFEVFLRETIHSLYRAHPEKLAKGQKGTTTSLSYADILQMSEDFSSIENLRESIVDIEIEKHKRDGASVSGLINFLKSEFKFEKDPYKAWYVIDGESRIATHSKITEIKDVRNSLIHDAGKEADQLLSTYPHLLKRDGALVINSDYYHECALALRSIAYSLANSITHMKYKCM